jgi:protein ImuA
MSTPASNSVVDELRQRIQRLAGASTHGRDVLPFGIEVIDRVLPGGGLTLGALHEVAGGGNGAIDGAAAALFAAGIAARTKGKVLWCVTRQDLFAPALAQACFPVASSMSRPATTSRCWHVSRRAYVTADLAPSSPKWRGYP